MCSCVLLSMSADYDVVTKIDDRRRGAWSHEFTWSGQYDVEYETESGERLGHVRYCRDDIRVVHCQRRLADVVVISRRQLSHRRVFFQHVAAVRQHGRLFSQDPAPSGHLPSHNDHQAVSGVLLTGDQRCLVERRLVSRRRSRWPWWRHVVRVWASTSCVRHQRLTTLLLRNGQHLSLLPTSEFSRLSACHRNFIVQFFSYYILRILRTL